MIFLIRYQRSTGKVIELRPYTDLEGQAAEDARLEAELALLGDKTLDYEVLLLEANTEDALRTTHSRYFKTAREIAST